MDGKASENVHLHCLNVSLSLQSSVIKIRYTNQQLSNLGYDHVGQAETRVRAAIRASQQSPQLVTVLHAADMRNVISTVIRRAK